MTTTAEIIIPLAIATYAGWADWNKCTGPTDANPVVESFCGDMRDALNESCSAMLSVPLPSYGLQIAGRKQITRIEFNEITKTSIKASYQACAGFWGGKLTYDEYITELADKASVLNLLYAALPASSKNFRISDPFAAANVPASTIQDKQTAKERGAAACTGPFLSCLYSGDTTEPWRRELQAVQTNLQRQLDVISDQIANHSSSHPGVKQTPPPRVPPTLTWRLATEVHFAIGSAKLSSTESCSNLLKRMTPWTTADAPRLRIRVVGYTDEIGDPRINQVLSESRAATVASCLAEDRVLSSARIEAAGEGVVRMSSAVSPEVRRASVFIGYESTP